MATAYIGLGSNQGDRVQAIHKALDLLKDHGDIHVQKVSSLYETEPLEYPDQDWFVNAVAEITTELPPDQLLKALWTIEEKLQRTRTIRWGPRTIDLDILLYERELISSPRLQIPHLRMHVRAFVLVPLAEIAPDLVHPVMNKTPHELLEQIVKPTTVVRLDPEQATV